MNTSPTSGRLLVAYAAEEISSRDYAVGILQSLRLTAPEEIRPPVRREDAVHAYVTGQIPVGEFLRIARG